MDTTACVHVCDFVVDGDEPEPCLPLFTLPTTKMQRPYRPPPQDDNQEDELKRQYLAISKNDQRAITAVLNDTDHRIYLPLDERDLDEETDSMLTNAQTVAQQELKEKVIANSGHRIYRFTWTDDPLFNNHITTGNTAVVVRKPADGAPEMITGLISSYFRQGGGIEEIEIRVPPSEVDFSSVDNLYFALSQDAPSKESVIAALVDAELIEGETDSVARLPTGLRLIETERIRLVGFLGAYQPHQFLMVPPLHRAVVAVALSGTTTIVVTPDFHAIPGDVVWMIAFCVEESEVEIVYGTRDLEKLVRAREGDAAICRAIGTFIIENEAIPNGVRVNLFGPTAWRRLF